MKKPFYILVSFLLAALMFSCAQSTEPAGKTAADILGNPEYQAISYGGYRDISRDIQPTIPQLKEDMKILSAMGIKLLRTYNVYYEETANLLKAISEMKQNDPDFEMYIMMGIWIDCLNAFTDLPVSERVRNQDSPENELEVARAVALANQYPDIVKIIAVGNEAMIHWQENYFVEPGIILNWVNYLQELKQNGGLPKDIWITSSDNFASWGGGGSEYHNEDLEELVRAVDFISMHTYPMHDTHYNPDFWGVRPHEEELSDMEKIEAAMIRSREYAIEQYESVVNYMRSLGVEKPVHIGETGWSTMSNEYYGPTGARATDEFKSARYHELTREWTDQRGITCFYFIGFDEKWKDAQNPLGSENHFGLINLQAQAKYALWQMVDNGVFEGLTRDGMPITKTFDGDKEEMMKTVLVPPSDLEIQARRNQN